MADPLYIAQATAYHGRDGAVKSSDGILDLEVHPPTELGGPGTRTNPEQLFAAGYATCSAPRCCSSPRDGRSTSPTRR